MKEQRIMRYKKKLEKIEERLEEIEEWKEFFLKEEKDKLATYKAFQEICEACMDIVAMMLKDMKKVPEEDYENIQTLFDQKLINEGMKNSLTEMNGLRNRIIHEYNKTEDKRALESINKIIPHLYDFVELIEKWLKKNL